MARRRSKGVTPRQVWGAFVFVGLAVATDPLPRTDAWLKFRAGVVLVGWAVGTYIVPLAGKLWAMIWIDRRWGSGRVAREAARAQALVAAGQSPPPRRRRFGGLVLRKGVPILGKQVKANVNLNGWTSTSYRPAKRLVYNTQRGGRVDLPGPLSWAFGGAQHAGRAAGPKRLPSATPRAVWEPIPGKPADWAVTWTYGEPIVRRPKEGTQTDQFLTDSGHGTPVVWKRLRDAITAVTLPVVDEAGDPVGDGFDVDETEQDPDSTPPAGYQWTQEGPQFTQRPYPWEAGASPEDKARVAQAMRRIEETRRRRG